MPNVLKSNHPFPRVSLSLLSNIYTSIFWNKLKNHCFVISVVNSFTVYYSVFLWFNYIRNVRQGEKKEPVILEKDFGRGIPVQQVVKCKRLRERQKNSHKHLRVKVKSTKLCCWGSHGLTERWRLAFTSILLAFKRK